MLEARGSLLILVGGLHGNEPAGVRAIERVFSRLAQLDHPLNGAVIGLAGNLRAMARGERFSARDLNRLWTREEVERARASTDPDDEGLEQLELLAELEPLLRGKWRRVVLLDLHSTSAEGAPFSIMGDTLQNRSVAFALPIPAILGLEERVDGTLLSYFSELGHTAVCVEGGQNDNPTTIDHHEAAIWITMTQVGLLRRSYVPDLQRHHDTLVSASQGAPRVVELRHRQEVPRDVDYEMEPGYTNFQPVLRGETLGHLVVKEGGQLRRRATRTPLRGLVLMPLYQGKGDDAFFIGRAVRPVWLKVSAWLRRLRLGVILRYLPGIHASDEGPRVLQVDTHVARWYVLEILHLFGYRRSLRAGKLARFVRRKDAL